MNNPFKKILKPRITEKDLEKLSEKELSQYLKQHPKLLGKAGYLSSVFDKIVKLKKAKKYDEMIILLDQALEKYPEDMDLVLGKAWALCALKHDDDCIKFCDRELKNHKSDKELKKWKKVARKRIKDRDKFKYKKPLK